MDVIELTRKLIQFETINPPGNELEICRYLEELFQSLGFTTTLSYFGERRCNLIATIGGSVQKPPIAITGHVDTVPLGIGDWLHDPFTGVIEEGRLYGRGTCDMKGGIAAAICAAIALKDQLEQSPGLTFLITGGEETGADGAKVLAGGAEKMPQIGALVVAEPTDLIPLAGHKGALWIKASCRGKAAHGSMPEKGENAIYKMAVAIQKLQDFAFDTEPHLHLGKPSLNIGTVNGGQNTNSVPDYAEVAIDIRTLPQQSHGDLLEALSSHLGEGVTLEPFVNLPGVWTNTEGTWFESLEDLVAQTTDQKYGIRSAPYFTDASVLTPYFDYVPTVILGPGSPQIAHTVNEYCEVEQLHKAVDIYRTLILNWIT